MKFSHFQRLATALVGILGILTTIGVVVITSKNANAGNWKEQLKVCAKSDKDFRVGCFEEVFYSAYSNKDVESFNIELETVERDYPESSMDCHTGGHQAGRRAASGGEYENAVLGGVSKRNICGNGFIHGAFDEVAHQKAPVEIYQQLAKICDKVPEEVRAAGCIDGYGHSTWLNKRDLSKSLDLCLLFSELESRKVCLAGIMMQMYREDPFTGSPPVMTIEKAEEVCNQVREKTGDSELERTCYYEAAWPLAKEAGIAAEEMLKERPAGLISWMPPTNLLENTKSLYLIAFNTCAKYLSWQALCQEKVSRSPIWRVSGDKKINEAICSVFPGQYAELCMSEERVKTVTDTPGNFTNNSTANTDRTTSAKT